MTERKKIINYFYSLIIFSLILILQTIQPISIQKVNSQYDQLGESSINANTVYESYDLFIDGDVLYYLDNYYLEIYNISNLNKISYLDYVYLEQLGKQSKIIVENGIAYISDVVSNINLINCHSPSNAAKFSSFIVGDFFDEIITFDVENNFLYIIVDGLLKVFNLTVLSSPSLVATYGNSSYTFCDLHIDNGKIYLLNPSVGFDILDISNPSNLTMLGNWHVSSNYLAQFKDTIYLYLLEENNVMNIFSVSSPSNPIKLYTFQIVESAEFKNFIIENDKLFVLNNLGFDIYDVSSLYNEKHLGSYQREDENLDFTAIGVKEDNVFMTSEYTKYGGDLYLIDITNPDEPILILPADQPWYWGSFILSLVMSLLYYVLPIGLVALVIFLIVRYIRRRDMREFRDVEKAAIKREKKEYWQKEH